MPRVSLLRRGGHRDSPAPQGGHRARLALRLPWRSLRAHHASRSMASLWLDPVGSPVAKCLFAFSGILALCENVESAICGIFAFCCIFVFFGGREEETDVDFFALLDDCGHGIASHFFAFPGAEGHEAASELFAFRGNEEERVVAKLASFTAARYPAPHTSVSTAPSSLFPSFENGGTSDFVAFFIYVTFFAWELLLLPASSAFLRFYIRTSERTQKQVSVSLFPSLLTSIPSLWRCVFDRGVCIILLPSTQLLSLWGGSSSLQKLVQIVTKRI